MSNISNAEVSGVLIARYIRDELSQDEQDQLNNWINVSPANKQLFDELVSASLFENLDQWEKAGDEQRRDRIWNKIDKKLKLLSGIKTLIIQPWFKLAAAIALIIGLSGALWLILKQGKQAHVVEGGLAQVQDAAPAGYKAKLTLANGSIIILDSIGTRHLAEEGGVAVTSNAGQVKYVAPGAGSGTARVASKLLYNTLSTSKGEIYSLTLSDGSRLWLNAASSVRFPVSFAAGERTVEITGEVYFEVAANKLAPFKVKAGEMLVEVTGTKFNVNSYTDETAIRTTLVEGVVKASLSGVDDAGKVLKPGEQARVDRRSGNETTTRVELVSDPDIEEALAWRNNVFYFNQAGIADVMKQLSRWYDIEVIYEGKIPKMMFGGKLPRSAKASVVLSILETNDVHFRIEGKKIIVSS